MARNKALHLPPALLALAFLASPVPLTTAAPPTVRMVGGTLQVAGTGKADWIAIRQRGPLHAIFGTNPDGRVLRLARGVTEIAVEGGGNDDVVLVESTLQSTVTGGAGDDLLVGGSAIDWIDGDEGRDMIWGRGGGDYLDGGPDGDVLYGGDGDDVLNGRAGNDGLSGGPGDDQLFAHDDQDLILGDEGSDLLDGMAGNDYLYGGRGRDRLYGEDPMAVAPVPGNDVLCGGPDNDFLWGGPGDDFLFGEEDFDVHDGGQGNNQLYVSQDERPRAVNGNLNAYALCEPLEDSGIAIASSGGALVIYREGRLEARGTPAADEVQITGDLKSIFVRVLDTSGAIVIEQHTPRGSGGVSVVLMAGEGADRITVSGSFATLLIDGGPGADEMDTTKVSCPRTVVLGGEGNDTFRAGDGPHFLFGGEADDVFFPGAGETAIDGGDGAGLVEGERRESVSVLDDYVLLGAPILAPNVEPESVKPLPVIALLLSALALLFALVALRRGARR